MMNQMMAETLTIGTAHKAALPGWPAAGKTGTSRKISATPGSSATPRILSPASGSAMTTARRPSTSPAAACRWRSGAASCAARIRACRSQACPALQRRRFVLRIVRQRSSPDACAADRVHAAGGMGRLRARTTWQRQSRRLAAEQSVRPPELVFTTPARSTARVASQRPSVTKPIVATPPRAARRFDPGTSRPARRTPRHALLNETKQRRGSAGAFGKRRHRAGDALRQHHAKAGEIDRHRQYQRQRRTSDRTRPPPPCASPPARRRSRAESEHAVEPEPHDQPRRQRRAGHIADRAKREGNTEIKRREAVEILQHEGRAGNPGEQIRHSSPRQWPR